MNITERLIENVIHTEFQSLDKETIERTKWRILDSIGVIFAGANAPGCGAMLNLINKWGGNGESTVLGHGIKAPAHLVAVANGLMMRSYDFEAIDAEGENKTSSPAHISGSTFPTALAMAEKLSASGKDMITALVIGDDLASRLATSSGMDFARGWDNTGTVNSFGTTAIASKLLKLNSEQVLNAFGIVLHQVAGSIAGVWDKTLSFKLPIALAGQRGIFSAELAQEGFQGVNDPFLGGHGYFSIYCGSYQTENLTRDLGKKFYADCVIKPWPCCRANHAAVTSAMEIVAKNDIQTENIEEILIHLTPGREFVCGTFDPETATQVHAAFSIPYTVACTFLRKSIKPEHFSQEHLKDPEIARLIEKMKFNACIPKEKAQNAEVIVKMKDEKIFSCYTTTPKGNIFRNPLSQEEILTKFRDNIAFSKALSQEKTEKIIDIVLKLEELQNVKALIALLVKQSQ